MAENADSRGSFWTRCTGQTPRDRGNLKRFLWIHVAWTTLFTGGNQLIKRELIPGDALPWVVAALPSIVGVFVVTAYARFLREADELQRTIHLQALALGFGGGWIGTAGYRILERAGAPPADIADAALILAVFFSIGLVRGAWHYR